MASKKDKNRELETVSRVVRVLMREFNVPRGEVVIMDGGKENFLRLMAVSLATELDALCAGPTREVFGIKSEDELALAKRRLEKYFKHIPGFRAKYEQLKQGLKK